MASLEAKSIPLDRAAGRLGEIADKVASADVPVRLKRGRTIVAVLVSPADADLAARERAAMDADIRAYDRAKSAFARDGARSVDWAQARTQLTARPKR